MKNEIYRFLVANNTRVLLDIFLESKIAGASCKILKILLIDLVNVSGQQALFLESRAVARKGGGENLS